jgi:hypothetical protein
MEAQLGHWTEILKKLSALANGAGSGAAVVDRRLLQSLKEKHEHARLKFDELRTNSRDALEAAWTAIEAEWDDLDAAFALLSA